MTTLPPLELLDPTPPAPATDYSDDAATIRRIAGQHKVTVTVPESHRGPAVTRYLLVPGPGVAPRKIEALTDALSVALGRPVRYAGQVGQAVGLEVPNQTRDGVGLRSLIEGGPALTGLGIPVGLGVGGDVVTGSLARLPHLLVAGATGQGKSMFLNGVLVSILMRNTPADVQMTLVDPKRVELTAYAAAPHLARPIVTDAAEAAEVIAAECEEMDFRYERMEHANVKDIDSWNDTHASQRWARRIVVVDELADLMMTGGKALEASLVRIAQLGRAAGVHLILATQYPRADVVTQLIKQNVPSRIAFTVADTTASTLILGKGAGAEKLTGLGDALWSPVGAMTPVRVQAPFVSDDEVTRVVAWWVEATAADRLKADVFAKLKAGRDIEAARAETARRAVVAETTASATVRAREIIEVRSTQSAEPIRVYSIEEELKLEIIAQARAARANEAHLPERVAKLEEIVATQAELIEVLLKAMEVHA